MANNPKINEPVKGIIKGIVKVVEGSVKDVNDCDKEKVIEKLKESGVGGFQKAADQSKGEREKTLFEGMKNIDDHAEKDITKMKGCNVVELKKRLCKMYNPKSDLMDEYKK